MKLKTDMDFVTLYAEAYKRDRRLFKNQKMLIESQMRSSRSFFLNLFGTTHFKENARKFLNDVRISRP